MNKTYTVDVSVTSNGHIFTVKTSDGIVKSFSDSQMRTVRTESGLKTRVKVTPVARIRSDEYIADLEAQGYTRELKGIEKDFAEMRELMDEMGYGKAERRKAIEGFIAASPIKADK